jgi:hypothetical protein
LVFQLSEPRTRISRGSLRTRAITAAAVTILTVVALLSADFRFNRLDHWWHSLAAAVATQVNGRSGAVTPQPAHGAILVTPPAPTGNDSSVSTIRKRLVLVEARPGRNANEGTARLGVDPSSPQTYVAGALLVNGARLAEIYPDHVVLEKDGQVVRLNVGDSAAGSKPPSTDALLMVGGPQAGSVVATVPSSDALTEYMRPSPVFEGTTLAGLEIYAGSDARTFARLGLLDGDVIRSVDGVPVSDAAATIAQLESLTQGRAVTVDVLRQGHLETISLDGAVIAAARAPASISSRESKYPR